MALYDTLEWQIVSCHDMLTYMFHAILTNRDIQGFVVFKLSCFPVKKNTTPCHISIKRISLRQNKIFIYIVEVEINKYNISSCTHGACVPNNK